MATLRELIIKISANSSSFQSEISRASRMGSDYYKTMEQGGRKAAAANRESQRSLSELNNQLVTVSMSAKNLAGIFAGLFTVKSALDAADQWGQFQSRIKMTVSTSEEFVSVQQRLLEISDRTYKSIDEQAELYIRSSSAMKELGYTTEGTIDFIDSISSSLTINAASAEKGARAIDALSKSMVEGKVSGDSWKAVMEVMPTAVGDIARYLGITETAVKRLAAEGKLSMKTFADAVIGAKNRNAELAEAMPTTIGDAFVKLENHFKTYVADANKATGTTDTISGAISTAADNMDLLVTATGGFIALGVVRYLGKTAQGFTSSSLAIIKNTRAEIGLAEAQLRGTQVSTARARAAVYRAQQAVVAARGTDAQAAAEKRLAAAQASVTRNTTARSAAQANLNSLTSVGARMMGGVLGLVGGIPGLVMLGAGAWYAMYQNQEQARASAVEYAKTLDQIREKLPSMNLPDVADNQKKAEQSLTEQNRLIAEQQKKVKLLQQDVETLNQARNNNAYKGLLNDAELIDGVASATEKLGVEQSRLSQMQDEASRIQNALSDIERTRNDLLRQQAAEQNKNYQSLLMMNGQYSQFNSLMSLGNDLLRQRQGIGNTSAPMRIPSATLDDKQAAALKQSAEDAELSKLKGRDRAKRQAELGADKLGFSSTPEYSEWRTKYVSDELVKYDNDQANKPEKKGPKTDGQKAEDSYKRIVEQQQQQIALEGKTTELAKISWETKEGELKTLTESQKIILARNATELDRLKVQEQFKSMQKELLTPEEQLLEKTRERVKLLKEAAPASEEYADTMKRIAKESIGEAPKFAGVDASVGGPSGEFLKVQDAEKELAKWHASQLEMQKKLLGEKEINEQEYADRIFEINKQNDDRMLDIQSGYTNASISMFADLASQSAGFLQGIGQEGSAAYKILFAASKAAAIAQAIINTEVAATKAMAEGGLILGIPAATAIRAVGYASVGLIAGQTLAGMAHDGIDKVPETGTWLLQKGERVTTASTSAKLDATLEKVRERQSAQGNNINIPININGNPDDRTIALLKKTQKEAVTQALAESAKQIVTGTGHVGKAMLSKYSGRNIR
ncbi:MAG TPA: phage tail tape measure protein [Buttiauxella sp.]|nr:phage tail tape measure protein [Buttiauxella sp.]